jgi:hypothetical protein
MSSAHTTSQASRMAHMTNGMFLDWLLGPELVPVAHVTGFPGDPRTAGPSDWAGWRWGQGTLELARDTNNYFCVSTFGQPVRQMRWFEALWVLGIDDVRTKVEAQRVHDLLGEPTCKIETSPGNEQWLYKLADPIRNINEAKHLQRMVLDVVMGHLNATDPGQINVTRYMRLPVGANGKYPGNPRTKLIERRGSPRKWDYAQARAGIEQRYAALGGGPAQAARPVSVPGPGQPIPGQDIDLPEYVPSELDERDLVLQVLRHLGLILGGPRPSGMGMSWDIRCPWVDEHTDRAETGTAYARSGAFRCHHGHCIDRGPEELRAKLDELLQADSGGLDGFVWRAFGTPPAGLAALAAQPTPKARRFRRRPQLTGTLKRRGWLAPGFLLRGAVTMLVGPPDQGKSAWLVTAATALALGRSLGRLKAKPEGRLKVVTLFCEEEEEEQDRRAYAAVSVYQAAPSDVDDWLIRLIPESTANLFQVDKTGAVRVTEAWDELVELVERDRPDVLILDPLVELHTANENDNAQLKAVVGALRSLAREFNCAVLITHHTNKAEAVPGNLAMARGASAIGGAVRVALTLLEMNEKEALEMGIPKEHRRFYVRVDFARNSQAVPSHAADWFHKHGVTLSTGDDAPVLVPWDPPQSTPGGQIIPDLVKAIGEGFTDENGLVRPWSPQPRDSEPRSIRALLRKLGVDRANEAETLRNLRATGEVTVTHYADPITRKVPQGYRRVVDDMPKVDWKLT